MGERKARGGFCCRQCRSHVGVRVPEWRVKAVGLPTAGGGAQPVRR